MRSHRALRCRNAPKCTKNDSAMAGLWYYVLILPIRGFTYCERGFGKRGFWIWKYRRTDSKKLRSQPKLPNPNFQEIDYLPEFLPKDNLSLGNLVLEVLLLRERSTNI